MITKTITDYPGERTLGLTSQQAVAAVDNRYDLVLIASRRVREINNGSLPRVPSQHGSVLTALKEIEQGHIGREYLLKPNDVEHRRRLHK